MKQRLRKLIDRVRRKPSMRWPWSVPRVNDNLAWLPVGRTGWTVHRDVALRLKELAIDERESRPGDPEIEAGAFKIRLAGSLEARHEAGTLVRKRYASRGYLTSATLVNSNACTFSAYDGGRLAGTVSLRLDSKDGLATDELYAVETDELRAKGHRICEFVRLAADPSHVSPPVLAALFHTVFLFAQKLRGFDFAIIEVNPRHVGYYRRALGFDVIGAKRHNPRVNAPAVLMGVAFAEIAGRLHSHGGKAPRSTTARNLYGHGFSPAEEEGVLGRLRSLDAG
ncbi:MAG: long-chain N-acyl amino acid synthase [Betaproteobacteria bacterium]